jgi:hypothetical protein
LRARRHCLQWMRRFATPRHHRHCYWPHCGKSIIIIVLQMSISVSLSAFLSCSLQTPRRRRHCYWPHCGKSSVVCSLHHRCLSLTESLRMFCRFSRYNSPLAFHCVFYFTSHALVHSFTHSFIHTCIHSFIQRARRYHCIVDRACAPLSRRFCSFVHSFIHSFIHSIIHFLICSLFM